MTNWYHAICREHREVCTIFVVGSQRGIVNPLEEAPEIGHHKAAIDFLSDHYTCRLELARDDNDDSYLDYKDRTPP